MPNPHQRFPELTDIRTRWESGYQVCLSGYITEHEYLSILKDNQNRYYVHWYQNEMDPEVDQPHHVERLGWTCHILAYQVFEDELVRFIIGDKIGK